MHNYLHEKWIKPRPKSSPVHSTYIVEYFSPAEMLLFLWYLSVIVTEAAWLCMYLFVVCRWTQVQLWQPPPCSSDIQLSAVADITPLSVSRGIPPSLLVPVDADSLQFFLTNRTQDKLLSMFNHSTVNKVMSILYLPVLSVSRCGLQGKCATSFCTTAVCTSTRMRSRWSQTRRCLCLDTLSELSQLMHV